MPVDNMKRHFIVISDTLFRHACAIVVVVLSLIIGSADVTAQVETSEYQIKAAFLYKFAAYVEWPAGSFSDGTSPLVFGVIGADPLADNLEQIVRDRRVQGRAILVRRLNADEPVTGLHVLFVGQSSSNMAEPLLFYAASMSVLTVTETASPRSSGSVINFEVIDDKVRFDVSLTLAQQGKLKISSRLLQVAYKVING